MAARRKARRAIAAIGVAALLVGTQSSAGRGQQVSRLPVSSLAPIEVVASRIGAPLGVAVDDTGTILISDPAAGTVSEIGSSGQPIERLTGLLGPAGLAFDGQGDLLVAEERAGRVLRRDTAGVVSTWAAGLEAPRWLVPAAGGLAYVSARGIRADRSGSASTPGLVVRVSPGGSVWPVADGFVGLEGLALVRDGGLVLGLRRLLSELDPRGTRLALLPVRPGGGFGWPVGLMDGGGPEPIGVAVDRLGAFVMSAAPHGSGDEDDDDGGEGMVLKRLPAGEVVTLASGLSAPKGIALEAGGHLLVAERGRGRLLRLRAPAPPSITAPAFTSDPSVRLRGTAAPGSRVDVFADAQLSTLVSSVLADASTGAFALDAPLSANVSNRRWVTATAANGRGLTSEPGTVVVVHDDRQPSVSLETPGPDSFVGPAAELRARAEDDGSGVASVAFRFDGDLVSEAAPSGPATAVVAAAILDSQSKAEGSHTIAVVATDRAGNSAATMRSIRIDRTPPDTRIVSGPVGQVAGTSATFVVSATDAQSPVFDYSWRLDGGEWTPFGAGTVIVLNGLAPGSHQFSVKARDLAGLEDLSPAIQTFRLGGLTVTILEPATGAPIADRSVWLRGTVANAAGTVAVMVVLPDEVRAALMVEAIPAPVSADTFALEVPVSRAGSSIVVVARDESGAVASASVMVAPSASPVSPARRFEVAPSAGFAPLTVEVGTADSAASRIDLDLESDGAVEFSGPTLAGQTFLYLQPGIYVPTFREVTPTGEVLESRALVEVYDRGDLAARLQEVWRGFKDALIAGEIERALSFVHSERRMRWRESFGQLPPDAFAATGSVFTEIVLTGVGRGSAECEMMREVDGLLYSYPVTFQFDADGWWRLWQF